MADKAYNWTATKNMSSPGKIQAENSLSEVDKFPENCNYQDHVVFETKNEISKNSQPPSLQQRRNEQLSQTVSIPQSFPVPSYLHSSKGEIKNPDTFLRTPCKKKKKKSISLENEQVWRELAIDDENENVSPLTSCRMSLFPQNNDVCGVAPLGSDPNNLKMNDNRGLSLSANERQNDSSPSGKMRRCFLGNKRSWDEDLDMSNNINHNGEVENTPNHNSNRKVPLHESNGTKNDSQPFQQSRQTENVGTPSRSPEPNQPKLRRLFLPTLCANVEDRRDELMHEDAGNKYAFSNNFMKEKSKNSSVGHLGMLHLDFLGDDDNKRYNRDEADNNIPHDMTGKGKVETLNKINELSSPPRRRIFQLGPRSQNNKKIDDLNDVSTRLFCPHLPTETSENSGYANASFYDVTSGPITYCNEPQATPRSSPVPLLFPAVEGTPSTTPRSIPVQTPSSKMRTYQSPGWSQAVSINPFSPVPPEYLSSDRTVSPRLSDSTLSTPRSQKKQQRWTVSPKVPKGPLRNDSLMEKHMNCNRLAFTVANRKYSPMDVADFPPNTPSSQKIIHGRRNYLLQNSFHNSPENTNIKNSSPQPLARQFSSTPTQSQLLSHSHTNDLIPDALPVSLSRFENDFQTLSVLGNGSFGTVLKCISRLDGCLYAIKRTRRSIRGSLEKYKFLKEVHALSALCNQPEKGTFHIVRYHQAWMEDGHLYIQTELCDQGNLLQYLTSKGEIIEGERWKILREILLALELVHHSQMVHLDIKPENIFVKNNHYKLGDFGLASTTVNAGGDVEEGDARYMPRELLDEGTTLDLTKCDIFSLGATMYEISRGCPLPYDGKEWQDIRSSQFLPLRDTSFELEILITNSMMHPDPTLRLSASQLLKRPQLLSEEERIFFIEKEKFKEANDALRFHESSLTKDKRRQSNPSF